MVKMIEQVIARAQLNGDLLCRRTARTACASVDRSRGARHHRSRSSGSDWRTRRGPMLDRRVS